MIHQWKLRRECNNQILINTLCVNVLKLLLFNILFTLFSSFVVFLRRLECCSICICIFPPGLTTLSVLSKIYKCGLAAGKTANMQKGKYWGLVKSWKSLSCISFTKLPLVTEWWRHKDWSQFQSFYPHFLDEIHRIDAWGKAQYVNRSWCLVGSGVEQEVELRARLCWRGWICG